LVDDEGLPQEDLAHQRIWRPNRIDAHDPWWGVLPAESLHAQVWFDPFDVLGDPSLLGQFNDSHEPRFDEQPARDGPAQRTPLHGQ
jgi:hypothetical protein